MTTAGATSTGANLHGRKRDLVLIRATTTRLLVALLSLLNNLLQTIALLVLTL